MMCLTNPENDLDKDLEKSGEANANGVSKDGYGVVGATSQAYAELMEIRTAVEKYLKAWVDAEMGDLVGTGGELDGWSCKVTRKYFGRKRKTNTLPMKAPISVGYVGELVFCHFSLRKLYWSGRPSCLHAFLTSEI